MRRAANLLVSACLIETLRDADSMNRRCLSRAALALSAILWVASAHAAESARAAAPLPRDTRAIHVAGVHNVFALGSNLFSGSAPDNEAGFAALAKLGVKTIISVDGARPDVDLARKHGMRYVHLPHGYDGIAPNVQAQLAKAAESLPGPVFIHCHHGQHRGPAAAAVICLANKGWSVADAEQFLTAAGTATNYVGLYDTVRTFRKPSVEQMRATPAAFPESVRVSGLVDAMVAIDDRWDHLKAVRAAGYEVPKDHPDIRPANEAVILWEHYREAQRLPETARRGAKFTELLRTAEAQAHDAERLLEEYARDRQPTIRAQLDRTFDSMANSCASCHRRFRDPAGIKGR